MAAMATESVGPREVAALKAAATAGALDGPVGLTCDGLADRLDASTQTASRRLQALEAAALIDREVGGGGQHVSITADGERLLRREYQSYRRLFDDDRVTLEGTVTDGMGEGRHYITLPGYAEQFRDRLGYEPFPGTLNVDLLPGSVRRRGALDALDPVPIDGWSDDDRTYGPAHCHPAQVTTPDGDAEYGAAHLIEPERTHHDDDHCELIAPDRLRDVLDLADDDRVVIHVGGS